MNLLNHIKQRSPYERIFHAVMYEVIGIATSAPIISLLSGKAISESGILAVCVAIVAMLWNYIFNLIFDKLENHYSFKKTFIVRILHGTFFEIGLICLTVPLIALIFSIGVNEAFLLELGMLLYFFPYTVLFNWAYDKLRLSIINKYETS